MGPYLVDNKYLGETSHYFFNRWVGNCLPASEGPVLDILNTNQGNLWLNLYIDGRLLTETLMVGIHYILSLDASCFSFFQKVT